MQSTCRRTMTVAPVALVLSLAVLHPDCADDALEREHLAALVRQIELADRLANQLADQTAPSDAPRDAGLAQVDSGGGYLTCRQWVVRRQQRAARAPAGPGRSRPADAHRPLSGLPVACNAGPFAQAGFVDEDDAAALSLGFF